MVGKKTTKKAKKTAKKINNYEDRLSQKQKKFCEEYVKDINCNQTNAAIFAGYSKNAAATTASRMLNLDKIQKYIKELSKPEEDKTIATKKEVEQVLTAIIRGAELEECVAVESCGVGFSKALIISKKVTPKDRLKALELLGRRHGMWDIKAPDGAYKEKTPIINTISNVDDGLI